MGFKQNFIEYFQRTVFIVVLGILLIFMFSIFEPYMDDPTNEVERVVVTLKDGSVYQFHKEDWDRLVVDLK